jgi:membrane fusion protein (multidrug efflux system)
VSKSDLDYAQASKDAADASLDAAKANLELSMINLSYCSIKSPIDGLIGKTEAREGEFVGKSPNPVILNVVSDIESARVQFFITESDYLILTRGIEKRGEKPDSEENAQHDNFELILADGTVYSEKGNFDFIDRNVDASTGSILIQTIFPNPKRLLRPGMFAKVRVKMETETNALLVPQRSVMEMQGQYSVYVLEEGNTVKSRQIAVGDRIGDLWLVKEGLKANDIVLIDGLQKVSSGMVVNPVQSEFNSQTEQ